LARFLTFYGGKEYSPIKHLYVTLDSYIPYHSYSGCDIWIYRHCGRCSDNCEDHFLHFYRVIPVEFDWRKKQSIKAVTLA
jgi:hypothetical protein